MLNLKMAKKALFCGPPGKKLLRASESALLGSLCVRVLGMLPCRALFLDECICRRSIELLELLYPLIMILDILIEDLNVLR